MNEISWQKTLNAIDFVMQDIKVDEEECDTLQFLSAKPFSYGQIRGWEKRVVGRTMARDVIDSSSGKIIAHEGEIITSKIATRTSSHIDQLAVRSPFCCSAKGKGTCATCFGAYGATYEKLSINTPIGLIAANALRNPIRVPVLALPNFSIGELPHKVFCESKGTVRFSALPDGATFVASTDVFGDKKPALKLFGNDGIIDSFILRIEPSGKCYKPLHEAIILVKDGDHVEPGDLLYRQRYGYFRKKRPREFLGMARLFEALPSVENRPVRVLSPMTGTIRCIMKKSSCELFICIEDAYCSDFEYSFKTDVELSELIVEDGAFIEAGEPLTDGINDYRQIFNILGEAAWMDSMLIDILSDLVPYGWDIDDRLLELILRQMISYCEIVEPGKTGLFKGHIVHRKIIPELNSHLLNPEDFAKVERKLFGFSELAHYLSS